MKEEMPLTGEDFLAIRKSVMSAIEARRSRRTRTFHAIQLAFATIAIVIGTQWLRRTEAVTPPPVRPLLAPTDRQAPGSVIAMQPTTAVAVPVRHHHHRSPRKQPVIAAANEAAPMRIELATADPDIRIIWIPNPNESR